MRKVRSDDLFKQKIMTQMGVTYLIKGRAKERGKLERQREKYTETGGEIQMRNNSKWSTPQKSQAAQRAYRPNPCMVSASPFADICKYI